MHDEPTVARNRTLRGDLKSLEEIVANWPDPAPLRIELSFNEGQAIAQFVPEGSGKAVTGVGKDFQAAIRDLCDVIDAAAKRRGLWPAP